MVVHPAARPLCIPTGVSSTTRPKTNGSSEKSEKIKQEGTGRTTVRIYAAFLCPEKVGIGTMHRDVSRSSRTFRKHQNGCCVHGLWFAFLHVLCGHEDGGSRDACDLECRGGVGSGR